MSLYTQHLSIPELERLYYAVGATEGASLYARLADAEEQCEKNDQELQDDYDKLAKECADYEDRVAQLENLITCAREKVDSLYEVVDENPRKLAKAGLLEYLKEIDLKIPE